MARMVPTTAREGRALHDVSPNSKAFLSDLGTVWQTALLPYRRTHLPHQDGRASPSVGCLLPPGARAREKRRVEAGVGVGGSD
jgi:hypothetical protein